MNTVTHHADNSTKRHPRTLQQAFGPYTSSAIWVKPEPMHPRDRIVVVASLAAAIALVCILHFFGA